MSTAPSGPTQSYALPRGGQQRAALMRQWQLVQYLHTTKLGRTVPQLVEHLGVSRPTVYRDLDVLGRAGVAISKSTVNGEARHVLLGDPLPRMRTHAGRLALALACEALKGFRGTQLFRELQKLRDEKPPAASSHAEAREEILATVERALSESRVVTLRYRGANDVATRARDVTPLELRLAKGQVYLLANDVESDAQRTFKIARIESVRLGARFDRGTREPAPMDRAVVTWSGDVVDVAIRISAEGARFVGEFALIEDQRVEIQDDGSVVVRARVAGVQEALRWTLSWGWKAEVLEPPALRAQVRAELEGALGAYADQVVSRTVRPEGATVVSRKERRTDGRSSARRNTTRTQEHQ